MAYDAAELKEILSVFDNAYSFLPARDGAEDPSDVYRYQDGVSAGIQAGLVARAADEDSFPELEAILQAHDGLNLDTEDLNDPRFLLGAFVGSITVHRLVRSSDES